jgi:NADH-ubiquinone oxidoreductase chain 3
MTFFILFVCIIALLFLFINLVFAPHNPYQEKDSMFECGFHSFQQSRSPFNITFFIYALVYLLLDLEILLTFPFAVSEYVNNIYGLAITLGFILMITVGFVFELGKGALKIPSKQDTSTIKNQPLIHISHITSTPLQSSMVPFTIFIKKIGKYFTLNNMIIGLITLIVVGYVKTQGIPSYILNLFGLEGWEVLEYTIAGVFCLVLKLGLKGVIELVTENTYATMGGEDPTQGSNSPLDSKPGGVRATDSSDDGLAVKDRQSGSSKGNKLESESTPEGISNTQTQRGGESSSGVDTQGADQSSSTNSSHEKYIAERFVKVYGNLIKDLVDEVKTLNISMQKTEDHEEWKKLSERVDTNMDQIRLVTNASTDELKKLVSSNTDSTPSKRAFDAVEKEKQEGEGPSTKK